MCVLMQIELLNRNKTSFIIQHLYATYMYINSTPVISIEYLSLCVVSIQPLKFFAFSAFKVFFN